MDENTRIINAYTPGLPPLHWEAVAPFVRETVRGYGRGRAPGAVRLALSYLAVFADWVFVTGIAAPASGLREDIIDAYTRHRASEVLSHIAERERRVLRALAGLPSTYDGRLVPTSSPAEAPYGVCDMPALRAWARWQRTENQQLNAAAIVSLGLGCGLTSGEMSQILTDDVFALADGLLGVRVHGKRSRVVPVTQAWNDDLFAVRDARATGEYLVAPQAHSRSAQTLAVAIQATTGELKPSPQRLRATWLVAHLNAVTPVRTLLAAAGLTSVDSFKRALTHVTTQDPKAQLNSLRQHQSSPR